MQSYFTLAMIAVGVYFLVIIAALIVHTVWLAPFIERHGRRSTGFLVMSSLLGLGLIQDYLAARQICQQRRRVRPQWMRCLGSLLVIAVVSAAVVIGYIFLSFFRQ